MTDPADTELSHLLDLSMQLEELPHESDGFNLLLTDNRFERTVAATCGNLMLSSDELPTAMVEAHYFPTRFLMSQFEAELLQLFPEDRATDVWAFNAKYDINGNAYALSANAQSAQLETTNSDGSELTYKLSSNVAIKFLASIVLGALRSGIDFAPPSNLENDSSDANTLVHYMYMIGNCHGEYVSQESSFLAIPEADRTLVVKKIERESVTDSAIEYRYKMLYRIGPNMIMRILSQQSRLLKDGKDWSQRFAERQPSQLEPSEIITGVLLQTDENDQATLLEPQSDRREYARINASIMATLRGYLLEKRYRHNDARVALETLTSETTDGGLE